MLVGSVSDAPDQAEFIERVSRGEVIAELLAAARSRCDIVVVDTPPGLGPITTAVLAHSERALIPLQCEPLALQTTPQILRGMQAVSDTNPSLAFDGIVLTMYEDGNSACERTAAYIREHMPPSLVLDVVVPRSVAVSEAFAAGQPVVLRDPADPAAQAYVNIATFLAQRITA
jgi:chromosome partitioning protein